MIRKSQSAMEYLMTYGWAILIIAVVLGAIYSLGLFNGATLAPHAIPGSCQVYRPGGPLSISYISLQGACTNELPQYVAYFPITPGMTSFINVSPFGLPISSNPRSVFVWFYLPNSPTASYPFYVFTYGPAVHLEQAGIWVYGTGGGASLPDTVYFDCYACAVQSSMTVNPGTWNFIGYTFSTAAAGTLTLYLNGQSQVFTNQNGHVQTVAGTGQFGPTCGGCGSGQLVSNLQVYNTSLDANQVLALYQEGIGGAPINLQGLVGWWPLNGNANDYSGDVNNGQSTNVIYTAQWQSGYTVP